MEKKQIIDNIILLKYYFQYNHKYFFTEEIKERILSVLICAINEDPKIFMRILLYIANTRQSVKDEVFYKIMIHFLSTMFPEIVFANLDLILKCGKKDDILYFMSEPSIMEKLITYVKHKAKEDNDFKILLNDGKLIGSNINRTVRYKPKFNNKKYKWSTFLFKILADPFFNGITV